jgi:hypothetical protein
MAIWKILWSFGIFPPFGMFRQEKSGNPGSEIPRNFTAANRIAGTNQHFLGKNKMQQNASESLLQILRGKKFKSVKMFFKKNISWCKQPGEVHHTGF